MYRFDPEHYLNSPKLLLAPPTPAAEAPALHHLTSTMCYANI
jgi:hypothetical protein